MPSITQGACDKTRSYVGQDESRQQKSGNSTETKIQKQTIPNINWNGLLLDFA
jgi:hypothetical protein